jgi:hypothetical protein
MTILDASGSPAETCGGKANAALAAGDARISDEGATCPKANVTVLPRKMDCRKNADEVHCPLEGPFPEIDKNRQGAGMTLRYVGPFSAAPAP